MTPAMNDILREAVAAWNKSDISDALLGKLVTETRAAINLLEAMGERGLVVTGLRQQLMSYMDTQSRRKSR